MQLKNQDSGSEGQEARCHWSSLRTSCASLTQSMTGIGPPNVLRLQSLRGLLCTPPTPTHELASDLGQGYSLT